MWGEKGVKACIMEEEGKRNVIDGRRKEASFPTLALSVLSSPVVIFPQLCLDRVVSVLSPSPSLSFIVPPVTLSLSSLSSLYSSQVWHVISQMKASLCAACFFLLFQT